MSVLPAAIISVRECVFNAAVCLHVLVKFWMDQSCGIFICEGFTLAVGTF